MSEIVSALFTTRVDDSKQFMVVSQGNSAGKMKLYSAVTGRFKFAFFKDTGAGGVLADVSKISSVTFLIWNDDDDFVLKTVAGNLPQITAAQWNNGLNPSAQHLLVEFTADELALEPGTYKLSIFGDDDALSGNDFYVECDLTVLPTGITSVFVEPLDDPTLYNALLEAVLNRMGDYALKIGKPGERIALTTAVKNGDGKYGRLWLGAVLIDDTTVKLTQDVEFVSEP